MSAHTPEPWTVSKDSDETTYQVEERTVTESWPVITIRGGKDGVTWEVAREVHHEEDARRIVACVNLLADYSTEDIENGNVELRAITK